MHACLADFTVNIPWNFIALVLIEAAESLSRFNPVGLEMSRYWGGRELAMGGIQLLHQEVLSFAEVKKLLNGPAIVLGELTTVLTIKNIRLLKRS
ncbi:hypothetical protein D3C78_1095640 [compost metagenome]